MSGVSMQNEDVSIAEKNNISSHSQDADILTDLLSIGAVEIMPAISDIGRRLNVVDLSTRTAVVTNSRDEPTQPPADVMKWAIRCVRCGSSQ
ncbi:hypothetical protein CSOJ01_01278 [Colletotrichum sojae]|uniref:Uncharacterized protein n=1 Tax=Colletotrichum sojae TaxID=2175907 RepID=A0A8H6JUP9_9PEZI|nr:hypothetical protein CSOJ01_01278 [Colletotrichum sojae]